MLKFRQLFSNVSKCPVIGMIHLDALPGTPLYSGSVGSILHRACQEAEILLKRGIDGIMVENMHDVPYIQSKHFGPETVAVMTRICCELRKIIPITTPFGLQVLACGNLEALAIAEACSMNFIRAEGFVFSHIADEGFTDASAGLLLRYRKKINAENVLVFADIKKKHSSHSITSDISLSESGLAAEFFLADALVLTGTATGHPASTSELDELIKVITVPVLVGSGVTAGNISQYVSAAGLIVGSDLKVGGRWENNMDENRVMELLRQRDEACSKQ